MKFSYITGLLLLISGFTYAHAPRAASAIRKEKKPAYKAPVKPLVISLAGEWQFMLDPKAEGKGKNWFNDNLNDHITLPGTTDEAHKGTKTTNSDAGKLTRVYTYSGAAWYKREVTIPADWANKHITFLMERTKTTTVWVDGKLVGTQNTLAGKQVYDLSALLSPGKHNITVLINNAEKPPVGDPHQISDNTQTNWNGVIGKIELRATDEVWMDDVQLYPMPQKHLVQVKIKFGKMINVPVNGTVTISANSWNTSRSQKLAVATFPVKADTSGYFTVEYKTGNNIRLWDEFSPALYKFQIRFSGSNKGKTFIDEKVVNTGFRDFKTNGKQFVVNGKTVFIRGKHDACVFPLTGYPPMTVDGWLKVFRIAKSYGINTYRFHSWCPPEAAFEAADIIGMYMQPELPIWGSIGRPTEVRVGDVEQHIDNDPVAQRTAFLLIEGKRILKTFGNYTSFVMFALGNELTGSELVMRDMVSQYRAYDNRHLYAQGSNNFLNAPNYFEGDDYWVTTMTGGHYTAGNYRVDTRGKDVRSSYPVDTVGHINNMLAGTTYDYRESIKDSPVPVLGHEIGQFQTYPNYQEIKKYTGVVQARNFEIFKKRLEAAGMLDQADAFFKNSGALMVLCYREEIETAMRTPGFGGFHLLDLQDFPGQGTALVGVLDAFMDSKGLITPEAWREFCSPTVALIKMKSYVWRNSDSFTADAEIANYGPAAITNAAAAWTLTDSKGNVVNSGKLSPKTIAQGKITALGAININFSKISTPQKLMLTLKVGQYKNSYPVWVYPDNREPVALSGIRVANKLDEATLSALNNGEKVLYFPEVKDIKQSVHGAFQSDFWSYTMFKKYSPAGTLGILCDPASGALSGFPTESHTNWQWWRLVRNTPAIVLNNMPQGFKPTIQIIDNLERNHKLGLLYEVKVGKGSLMVCSINLPASQQEPEGRSLYESIGKYMQSAAFNPAVSVDAATLEKNFVKY